MLLASVHTCQERRSFPSNLALVTRPRSCSLSPQPGRASLCMASLMPSVMKHSNCISPSTKTVPPTIMQSFTYPKGKQWSGCTCSRDCCLQQWSRGKDRTRHGRLGSPVGHVTCPYCSAPVLSNAISAALYPSACSTGTVSAPHSGAGYRTVLGAS